MGRSKKSRELKPHEGYDGSEIGGSYALKGESEKVKAIEFYRPRVRKMSLLRLHGRQALQDGRKYRRSNSGTEHRELCLGRRISNSLHQSDVSAKSKTVMEWKRLGCYPIS
jgi:hypothetical protein